MNTVERILAILDERSIPVSRLERACGFANGYIKGLREGRVPADRLFQIADYLGLDPRWLVTGDPNYYEDRMVLSQQQLRLLTYYDKLNEIGRHQASDYLADLAEHPKYRK